MIEYDLLTLSILIIAFIWSGFVRAGLGFGGSLMYPIAFLAVDSVIFLVPLLCTHMLIFSSVTLIKGYRQINYPVVWRYFLWIFPAFLVGIFGLINFPDKVVLFIVSGFLLLYSLQYIFDFQVANKRIASIIDFISLQAGGYSSGLSFSGAPLIAAVVSRHLNKANLKASLFLLWWILVIIKLFTLHYYDVDLQWQAQLWAFPAALTGHLIGSKFHTRLLQMNRQQFNRWLGMVLLLLTGSGLIKHLF